MRVDSGQLRLTAWMLRVGSGQVRYLKVIHTGRRTLGGATPVPLVQSVPCLGAQYPGCLLLLKVLDEGHSSIGTGQVVPTCRIMETELQHCVEKMSHQPPSSKGSVSHDQTFEVTSEA